MHGGLKDCFSNNSWCCALWHMCICCRGQLGNCWFFSERFVTTWVTTQRHKGQRIRTISKGHVTGEW